MTTAIDVQFYGFLFFIWLISTLLIQSFIKKRSKSQAAPSVLHPPSPPALPIIGHLHVLSLNLPKSFKNLASKYGPLMRINIGASACFVVSNAAVAKEILKTHDLSFASRPEFGSSDYSIYRGSRFLTAEYGTYWRFMRKICMTELLSASQLSRFIDVREQEIMRLMEILVKRSGAGEVCDLGAELMTMANNVVCRMAMSTRCTESADEAAEVRGLVKEILKLGGKLSLGEVLGPLKKFDLFGFGKRLRALLLQFDALVEGIMMEHEKKRIDGGREKKDMMDILLEIYRDETAEVKLSRNDIKSLFLDIFLAGTETMSVAMQWTLAELINHPQVFKKLREEIDSVLGPTKLVEESDIPNLPYLQSVVKESLRLHPPAPLLIRQCREDCRINGYDILENSRILINLYSVMRDPDLWKDPAEFVPERFLVSSIENFGDQQQKEIRDQIFHYIPFGSGRRACPGASLVAAVMHVAIGALVQCFDWKIKGGDQKLNMEEGLGFSAGMTSPLACYPIIRINPLEITLLSK
ncbi:cytochrome P450 93A3 [Malania oleifera]|uniref:cytochrome P450 93A3 n=1 Tax=Malania oleifera TaxID=397392 RepID=UPI0025ADE799|nr:cytochrome P450 93A3 [Malania oleifera]